MRKPTAVTSSQTRKLLHKYRKLLFDKQEDNRRFVAGHSHSLQRTRPHLLWHEPYGPWHNVRMHKTNFVSKFVRLKRVETVFPMTS